MTTHLGNLVKLAKQFVEHNDELFGRAVAGQSGEADNVSVENTERNREEKDESLTQSIVKSRRICRRPAGLADPLQKETSQRKGSFQRRVIMLHTSCAVFFINFTNR